jgi:hypothetical protein
MSSLTIDAQDTLLHMTGCRAEDPEPRRNRYVGPADSPGLPELVAAGLAECLGVWRLAREHAWRATPAGLAEAERLASSRAPKLTRAQRRYRRWLSLSDVYDVSFREFLVSPKFADHRRVRP